MCLTEELIKQYKKYYLQLYKVYSTELFVKIWGDSEDEYGEEYTETYGCELVDLAIDFSNYLVILDKYEMPLNEDILAYFLLSQMNGLSLKDSDSIEGTRSVARLMLYSISNRVGMNSVDHPLKNKGVLVEGDNESVSYVLIREEGYYEDNVYRKVLKCSNDRSKLEGYRYNVMAKFISLPRFSSYYTRTDICGQYHQIVNDEKEERITWLIEEVGVL